MTTPDGTTNDIGYDATNQLTGVDYDYQTDESYTYDDNGNRTNAGYSTGTGNRLLADGTYRYEYDDEGNRTLRYVDADSSGTLNTGDTDVTEYEWDYHNRLTKVSDFTTYANYDVGTTAQTVEYAYDYLDRRIQRKLDSNGSTAGGVDYFYNVYQGDNAALEIHDVDGLASGGYTPHREHRYLYGNAVDEVLISEDSSGGTTGTVLWGLGDHEGTIRDIIRNDRTVVDHRKFDAFGKMTSESAPATDFIFGYTGQALDNATGLYDYGHRWYDVNVGRFATEDPSAFKAGDMNLYRYVGNNPLNNTDPSGLCSRSNTPSLSNNYGLGNNFDYRTVQSPAPMSPMPIDLTNNGSGVIVNNYSGGAIQRASYVDSEVIGGYQNYVAGKDSRATIVTAYTSEGDAEAWRNAGMSSVYAGISSTNQLLDTLEGHVIKSGTKISELDLSGHGASAGGVRLTDTVDLTAAQLTNQQTARLRAVLTNTAIVNVWGCSQGQGAYADGIQRFADQLGHIVYAPNQKTGSGPTPDSSVPSWPNWLTNVSGYLEGKPVWSKFTPK